MEEVASKDENLLYMTVDKPEGIVHVCTTDGRIHNDDDNKNGSFGDNNYCSHEDCSCSSSNCSNSLNNLHTTTTISSNNMNNNNNKTDIANNMKNNNNQNHSHNHMNCHFEKEVRNREEMVECAFDVDVVVMAPLNQKQQQQQQQNQQMETKTTTELDTTRVSSFMTLCKTCAEKSFYFTTSSFICIHHRRHHHHYHHQHQHQHKYQQHNTTTILPILEESPTSSIQEDDDDDHCDYIDNGKNISIFHHNQGIPSSSSAEIIRIDRNLLNQFYYEIQVKNCVKNPVIIVTVFELLNNNNFHFNGDGSCSSTIFNYSNRKDTNSDTKDSSLNFINNSGRKCYKTIVLENCNCDNHNYCNVKNKNKYCVKNLHKSCKIRTSLIKDTNHEEEEGEFKENNHIANNKNNNSIINRSNTRNRLSSTTTTRLCRVRPYLYHYSSNKNLEDSIDLNLKKCNTRRYVKNNCYNRKIQDENFPINTKKDESLATEKEKLDICSVSFDETVKKHNKSVTSTNTISISPLSSGLPTPIPTQTEAVIPDETGLLLSSSSVSVDNQQNLIKNANLNKKNEDCEIENFNNETTTQTTNLFEASNRLKRLEFNYENLSNVCSTLKRQSKQICNSGSSEKEKENRLANQPSEKEKFAINKENSSNIDENVKLIKSVDRNTNNNSHHQQCCCDNENFTDDNKINCTEENVSKNLSSDSNNSLSKNHNKNNNNENISNSINEFSSSSTLITSSKSSQNIDPSIEENNHSFPTVIVVENKLVNTSYCFCNYCCCRNNCCCCSCYHHHHHNNRNSEFICRSSSTRPKINFNVNNKDEKKHQNQKTTILNDNDDCVHNEILNIHNNCNDEHIENKNEKRYSGDEQQKLSIKEVKDNTITACNITIKNLNKNTSSFNKIDLEENKTNQINGESSLFLDNSFNGNCAENILVLNKSNQCENDYREKSESKEDENKNGLLHYHYQPTHQYFPLKRQGISLSEFDASSFHNDDDNLKSSFLPYYSGEIECYDELNSNSSNDDTIGESVLFHSVSNNNGINNFQYLIDNGESQTIISDNNNYYYDNDNNDDEYEFSSSFVKMREINSGPLRGLLKKPNRPPATRKNRVVFDETRNEFFEADYIILIREDCAYDEEDEEPCTCGEHELVRLCCEEGCQCNYGDEKQRTPQSPKFTPPIEFVDDAALSPPEGYKDGLKNTFGGALGGHVFGAQHIQQLQVIQRLQQQRAAMLAARAAQQQQQQVNQASSPVAGDEQQTICTECAECVECAAKQLQDKEFIADCEDDVTQLAVPTVALVPVHNNSPERRITQKEIIAGEERPKYILAAQHKGSQVTERRVVREATTTEDINTTSMTTTSSSSIVTEAEGSPNKSTVTTTGTGTTIDKPITPSPIINHGKSESLTTQISGILKGGKLWKSDQSQTDDHNNQSSEEENNTKRSVRFITENSKESQRSNCDEKKDNENEESEQQINEYVPFKHKHSSIFNNALRPNSALRQLFPSVIHPPPATILTHEALRAFDESKRTAASSVPNLLAATSDTDTIRRTIERNALRRSLIKKKTAKPDLTLEERIKQLTCDIDETTEDTRNENKTENNNEDYKTNESEQRNSPTNDDSNIQQHPKYIPDKSFSPSSSASSSSSGSTTAHRRATDMINRDNQLRQEKFNEQDEASIVIIPQECRCPAAPDLGLGVQVPVAHTQIHQTPPRQSETRRQFLSTLSPLTACVAGQKDDLSYYTLAAGDRNSTASSQCSEYSSGEVEAVLFNDESRKVAPDVIAGTPGQEQDELAAFAQQEANRTEKIKKRYSNDAQNHSNVSSDDDEQNDYGFNKRPTVRGIKPKFSSTNEILQQMQAQLNQMPTTQQVTSQNTVKSYTHAYQTGNVNNNRTQQNQNTIIRQQQNERTWAYYPEMDQRAREEQSMCEQQPDHIYQTLPGVLRHTFHGREESLMYQNCQNITMEHHYGGYAKSPTRRPESPPPLRNYHQTMLLIPYNAAEPLAHLSKTEHQTTHHQFHHQNILEYQQVTQQTIRVPISYALPGMQLHVIAGRGAHHQATTHYIQHQHPRLIAPRGYTFRQDSATSINYADRGTQQDGTTVLALQQQQQQQHQQHAADCKNLMSPTSVQNANQQQQQQQQQNCTQASQTSVGATTTSTGVPEAVFYAMNV